jgi:hypothetical protein
VKIMFRPIACTIGLSLIIATSAREGGQKPFSNTYGAPVTGDECKLKDIQLRIRDLQVRADKWEIELELHNNSAEAIFILTDPVQATGEAGPYLDLDPSDGSVLNIRSQYYEGPKNYYLFSNATRVKLVRLEPRTSYTEKFVLTLPLRLTIPPYGETPQREVKELDSTKIKSLKVSIGLLPDDEGVRDLIQRKPNGPYSKGGERILTGAFKGRGLSDLQTIVSTSSEVNDPSLHNPIK